MLRVMIVDDSLIMRKTIRKAMEKLGHRVVKEARSAQEAIDSYLNIRIDLVTMDITMRGYDGIHATKEIISHNKNAKIVMVTSHGQEEMVVDSIKAGAIGYILKPINPEKIDEIIKTVFKDED